jgi:Uma2 family endonuclease
MPREDWPLYAPPLIVEILSPSNSPAKVALQRVTAMSAGTQEFWIVNRDKQTVEISRPDQVQIYRRGDVIPLFGGSRAVHEVFG